MTDLQKYYETSFKTPDMPEWDELPESFKNTLEGSLSYNSWLFREGIKGMGSAIEPTCKTILDALNKLIPSK